MDEYVTMAHGAGGSRTAELIGGLFGEAFQNEYLTKDDAAILPHIEGRIAMSTDGFIVSPCFFPGGDIGKLSICGTVNDLACMGARPLFITCAFVIEEGFPMESLKRIVSSMGMTAKEAGVHIVAGDTKTVPKGQADGIYITTSGIGIIPSGIETSGANARPGDSIIVTGDAGRHGCAILLARGDYGLCADVKSDCAPLNGCAAAALSASGNIHTIRDATRGGMGTVLYEIAEQSGVGIKISRESVPLDDAVSGVCGMLGLDPLYLACEGRFVMVVPKADEESVIAALRKEKYSRQAAVIGHVTGDNPGRVTVTTALGSEVMLPRPTGELLPRIC